MKASELRIGNLVYFFKDTAAIVIAISSEELYLTQGGGFINPKTEECIPIPLTEEWLLRFGFEKEGVYYSNSHLEISEIISKKGYDAYCTDMDFSIFMTELKYVHQLQNLYFALTGEELKLKENEDN